MTKKEAAIIMAYTGVTTLSGEDFRIFHEYAEKMLGRPVFSHEFGNVAIAEQLKAAAAKDFMELCTNMKEG